MIASRLFESYHRVLRLIDPPTVTLWGGTSNAHNRTSELWLSHPPHPSCLSSLGQEKGKGAQGRKRGREKKQGSGLALSPPCLPTSRGMSLEGFKVPWCGHCCYIALFPIDLYCKAERESVSEPRCNNS